MDRIDIKKCVGEVFEPGSVPGGAGLITYLAKVTCILGSPHSFVCCLDGRRKRDELGLDSWPHDRCIASAGKERRPPTHIGGIARGGALRNRWDSIGSPGTSDIFAYNASFLFHS